MRTERLDASIAADVTRAAELLRMGQTVAFPTETVYGLGANALDAEAVERIFEAKGRPHWDPLIVHVASREQLTGIVYAVAPMAEKLMDAFWPGPLTLLLPRTAAVGDCVTAGRALVGVRMPGHKVALALLREAGVPIAAPSANTFGHTSPTTAAHVLADLDTLIGAVLDGGATSVGVESTVAEVTAEGITVYRPGAVTEAMLEAIAGAGRVHRYEPPAVKTEAAGLPSPGVGLRHYAPRARLQLIGDGRFQFASLEERLIEAAIAVFETGSSFGVMLPDGWRMNLAPFLYPWGPWDAPDVLARRVFSGLRALDDAGVETILCPVPLGEGIERAIRDRLYKAAMKDSG